MLVGCLVALAVLLVGGGGAAYYFFGRPILAGFNAARDLGRIQQIEGRVTNRSSYPRPADGLLTSQQVDRYMAVSSQVYDRLENRVAVLDERYRDLDRDGPSLSGFSQAASAWAELLKLIVDAKQTQVSALNANAFSLAEYAWVREQVLSAAGFAVMQVDLTALVNEGGEPTSRQPVAQAPQANVDLVAPFAQEIEKLVPLAVFGL